MRLKKIIASLVSAALLGSLAVANVSAAENGNEVLYYDGTTIVYSGDKTPKRVWGKSNFQVAYTVEAGTDVTAEYLGLSEGYTVTKSETEENTYVVAVEDEETMNSLYDAAQALLDNGKITNAYKQFNHGYSCIDRFRIEITLKEEDASFDPSSYEGLEGFEFTQSESDTKVYISESTGASNYLVYRNANLDVLAEVENIESYNFYEVVCAVAHTASQKTYLIDIPQTDIPFDGKGDANGDGVLNVRDAALIARAIADGEGDTLPENADFNEDGVVNVRDAAAIARHLAENAE